MEERKVNRVYTNQVSIEASTFDLNFIFYSKKGTASGGTKKEEDIVADIVMSPQHAKAFAIALSENIKKYEELFGDINLQVNQDALNEVNSK